MKKTVLSFLFSAIVLAATAYAEDQPRLITVTGEGEVMVVPDEAQVNLLIETFDPILADAKKSNDDAAKQVLAIVKKYNVDDKDFQTDHLSVRNEERFFFDQDSQQQRSRRGYFVTKNVAVTLRDISKFEALYGEALESGVNNISGVEFKTSQLKKLHEEARKLAVQAAKEKAVSLAGVLGQEVGRPTQIQENIRTDDWPRPMMMKAAMAESAVSATNETLAFGQIKVTTSVTVSFELK